jgi:hypothetical protein
LSSIYVTSSTIYLNKNIFSIEIYYARISDFVAKNLASWKSKQIMAVGAQ